jgi:hypothetical protein
MSGSGTETGMRIPTTLSAILLAVAVAAPIARAGDARLVGLDSYAAPGGTVSAAVELSNDTGTPLKFKLKSRLMGDTKNGKKVKQEITLGPGEKRVVDLALGVPDGASGTLMLESKVRWSGGKQDITDWVLCVPGGPPSDPGGGRPTEVLKLTGTVSVVSTDPPTGRAEARHGRGRHLVARGRRGVLPAPADGGGGG